MKLNWDEIFETNRPLENEQRKYTNRRIASMLNKEIRYVSKMYNDYKKRHGLKEGIRVVDQEIQDIKGKLAEKPKLTTSELIDRDRSKIQESAKVRELSAKYNYILKELDLANLRFDSMINIKQAVDVHNIEFSEPTSKHAAVPVIGLSDWHFEERVDPDTINNLNEYNLEIAEARWWRCIQNSLKLVHKERSSSEIDTLILWLGGDFITGYIHEELEESNYLSPTQATRFAKARIISALNFYRDHGKFKKIVVVCNYGNHGRTNKKPRVGTGYKNSYEWMMYKDIEDQFSGERLFEFVIPNGLFAYVNVFDLTLRFWHGDTVQYAGGIGGLTVPLIKAVHRYDQQIHADYNFMGHYHQLFQATKNCIVNGSGIGFNAYAQKIGASPEDPMQSFCIIDSKYGLTIKTPIFCK